MSIFPLTGLFAIGLNMLSVPIAVQDVIYTESDGQDVQTPLTPRIIQCAVDPTKSRQMEHLFGGSVSEGDIGVYTQDTLYIDDIHAPAATRSQSFVTYEGFQFRAAEVQPWRQQTGFQVYLCKRHVVQQLV